MLSDATKHYLESHKREHLAELLELLAIPSISLNSDDGCDRAAAWLERRLRGLGMKAQVLRTGGKSNVIADLRVADGLPTVLFYGHYDVQAAEPLNLWESPPFRPEVRDGWIYARGADDDKGQLYTHLMAVEAMLRTDGLPVNVRIFLEGEEELGSPGLESFIEAHRDPLACDAAVVSDSAFFARDTPSVTYAFRGLVCVELTLTGPGTDLHSGHYGGAVTNPVNALAAMIAGMHDESGRVALNGFYRDVSEAGEQEVRAWRRLGFDEARLAEELKVESLSGGEKSRGVLERLWSRPTLDCNGISGGGTGKDARTIVPATAMAMISMRLVPDQDPDRAVECFRRFIAHHTPPGIKARVRVTAKARPLLLDWNSPALKAACQACAEAFGAEPALIRSGCSVPVTDLLHRLLGADLALLSFGLPEDHIHGPNERFPLEHLYRGAAAVAAFMQNYARLKGV